MFWQHCQTVSTFCGHKALYISMRHFLVIAVMIATGTWAQHVANVKQAIPKNDPAAVLAWYDANGTP